MELPGVPEVCLSTSWRHRPVLTGEPAIEVLHPAGRVSIRVKRQSSRR